MLLRSPKSVASPAPPCDISNPCFFAACLSGLSWVVSCLRPLRGLLNGGFISTQSMLFSTTWNTPLSPPAPVVGSMPLYPSTSETPVTAGSSRINDPAGWVMTAIWLLV